jgi:DNA-binding MarR family transcriptional regulator
VPKQVQETKIYLLHKIVHLLDKQADSFLQNELGITYTQFMILMFLEQQPHISQKEIASKLNFTQAAISRQIESLHYLEFLERQALPHNRRRNRLLLTTNGQTKLEYVYQNLIHKSDVLFQEVLTTSELRTFHTALTKTAKHLQSNICDSS